MKFGCSPNFNKEARVSEVKIGGTFGKTGQKCAQNNNSDIILWASV
jgi:hypothetical protein